MNINSSQQTYFFIAQTRQQIHTAVLRERSSALTGGHLPKRTQEAEITSGNGKHAVLRMCFHYIKKLTSVMIYKIPAKKF